MATIGFIGLGNMGGPMAANLVKAGHTVAGFDLAEPALTAAAEAGITVADSAAAAVAGADIVVTMLPAGAHVRDAYLGGLLDAASDGALLIDSSTIDVATAREVAEAAAARGFAMVDAPVSGGVAAAAAGTLTFMVGGPDDAFARAQPVLADMGRTIVHAGAAGTGQAAKICNNMMLGIHMISVSEAFVLAENLGLEAQKLFDISANASGQCWSLTTYCPVPGPVPASPANRDYQPGFTAAMMLKDLRLAHDAAAASGATTELGEHARALYERYVEAGNGGVDFSGIVRMVRGA